MNFISIFVVLGAVALCKHGVDANLRGDYLGLDDEHERFELLGRRRVLRGGYVPIFPLNEYFEYIRDIDTFASMAEVGRNLPNFEKWCGLKAFDDHLIYYARSTDRNKVREFWRHMRGGVPFCQQGTWATPAGDGLPPICYVCGQYTGEDYHSCHHNLGVCHNEQCRGHGILCDNPFHISISEQYKKLYSAVENALKETRKRAPKERLFG